MQNSAWAISNRILSDFYQFFPVPVCIHGVERESEQRKKDGDFSNFQGLIT